MIRILAAVAVLLLCTAAAPFQPFEEAGIDVRPGAAVPLDSRVVDDDGTATTLRALAAGRPILLVPVLHACPNICGVTLSGLADAIANQSYRAGGDFTLVAFGIDPRESPADAAAAQERLLALASSRALSAGTIHAVTAEADVMAAVTDALGYRYGFDQRIGQYAHVAAAAVLTADGRLTRWLYGLKPQPSDLKLALTEAGEGTIGSFGAQLLLLCYHYDPETGTYNSLVWGMLRVGGVVTVAGLGGFLGLAFWRDKRSRNG